MALGVILCDGLFVQVRNYRKKWIYVIIGSPVVTALILSESRAGWIAACSGILYLDLGDWNRQILIKIKNLTFALGGYLVLMCHIDRKV